MSISILPPEILGEIFVCAQSNPIFIPFRHRDQHIVLTQVCRHWHAVVFLMPSLWTCILIWFTDPLQLPKFIEVAQRCLLRSGDFPVTFHVLIQSRHSSRATLVSLSDAVVQRLIRPNARRWRKLNLLIAPESFDLLLSLPIGSFLNLKELTVRTHSSYPKFRPLGTLSTALARSPLLTHLKLSTYGSELVNTWNLQCPWKQITHIDLSASKTTIDYCYAILQECHLLEQFLVFTVPSHKSLDISPPIVLPHLHSLSVSWLARTDEFSTFLTPFVTPNLKYFCFNCFEVGISLHTIGFRAFQTRSNFQLEHLELHAGIHDGPGFHDILASCPSLLKLQIPDQWFLRHDEDLVRGVIIPKLEHLVLISGHAHSSKLLAFVDARTRPGYPFPLKRLEASLVNVVQLRKRFEEYISRGLQVG